MKDLTEEQKEKLNKLILEGKIEEAREYLHLICKLEQYESSAE